MDKTNADLAYATDVPPEFDTRTEDERLLHRLGGVERIGRLVDGEIARLRDELARERSKTDQVWADLHMSREETRTQSRLVSAYATALNEMTMLARERGATDAEIDRIESDRHKRGINALVDPAPFA